MRVDHPLHPGSGHEPLTIASQAGTEPLKHSPFGRFADVLRHSTRASVLKTFVRVHSSCPQESLLPADTRRADLNDSGGVAEPLSQAIASNRLTIRWRSGKFVAAGRQGHGGESDSRESERDDRHAAAPPVESVRRRRSRYGVGGDHGNVAPLSLPHVDPHFALHRSRQHRCRPRGRSAIVLGEPASEDKPFVMCSLTLRFSLTQESDGQPSDVI